jgi:hypothetical protein
MRRVVVMVMLVAGFQLLTPAPASAFWRWIDEWSGPGPFNGVGFQMRLICIKDVPATRAVPEVEVDPATLSRAEKTVRVLLAAVGDGCLFQPEVRTPRASFNFEAAHLWSNKNPLPYTISPVPTDTSVQINQFEPSVSVHLDQDLRRDFIEVGVGIGFERITGPAGTFTRAIIEPIRWDIRPLAFLWDHHPKWNIVTLRVGLLIVPRGYDANDFGADPGSFHQSVEVLPTLGMVVDLRKLLALKN